MNEKKYVIVTRHPALVTYLKEKGFTGRVLTHATVEDVKRQDVVGVLPHSLSCLTNSYTEVVLRLPLELRGKELLLDDVRKYVVGMATYKVSKIAEM